MISWSRGNNRMLSKYFNAKEMTCSCGICSLQGVDEKLLEKLDELREAYGGPITVTSGRRCALKQAQLTKQGYETAKGISSHETGLAADLTCSDVVRLATLADQIFDNLGVGHSFIHVDVRPIINGHKRRWGYKT